MFPWIGVCVATALMSLSPVAARAHEQAESPGGSPWSAWVFTPDIVLATSVVAVVYAVGMARRAGSAEPQSLWRPISFFAGLALIFLALQSPIDSISEHLFFVHQVQHLLLHMAGPMLISVAWPQGILVAGLPTTVRRSLLAPVVSNVAVRRIFGAVAHPVVATAIFIGSLYFWEIPRYHNIALLNESVHYAMHATMLFSGLVFWWRIFDQRTPPQGLRYSVRLMMVLIVILSNIALGAYTTLKTTPLYDAYDQLGRLFDYAPLADEQIGGIIIWGPGAMMAAVAILVVIYHWARYETRLDNKRVRGSQSRSATMPYPTVSVPSAERQRPNSGKLALALAAFAFMIFAAAMLIGLLSDLSRRF